MSLLRSFSLLAIALSFGTISLGATSAQAAICCSSSKCQSDNPPPLCDNCNSNCAEDEQSPLAGEIVYDEAESICYVAGDLDSDASEEGCE